MWYYVILLAGALWAAQIKWRGGTRREILFFFFNVFLVLSTHPNLCMSTKFLGQDFLEKLKVQDQPTFEDFRTKSSQTALSAVPINMEFLGVVIIGLNSVFSISFFVYSLQHVSLM